MKLPVEVAPDVLRELQKDCHGRVLEPAQRVAEIVDKYYLGTLDRRYGDERIKALQKDLENAVRKVTQVEHTCTFLRDQLKEAERLGYVPEKEPAHVR